MAPTYVLEINIEKLTKGGEEYVYDKYQNYIGFFSIVSYKEGRIYMSVDLLSEKSLFYYQDTEILVIGSTIGIVKELLDEININIWVNQDKLNEYFMTRHLIQYKDTIWESIQRVLPGRVHSVNIMENEKIKQNIEEAVRNTYKYVKKSLLSCKVPQSHIKCTSGFRSK